MHPLLARQLKKIFNTDDVSSWSKPMQDFIHVISETYKHYEEDYHLVERALDLSSKELTQKNQKLRDEIKSAQERTEELIKINNLMVGRELKMIELKKRVNELEIVNQPKR